MTNNYKTDTGKAPIVSAVFIPFGKTLLAIAEMMERQKVRHKLQGARDPFQEWRQLPDGKDRLVNAGGRHALTPWTPNTKDRVGDHPGDLHILHAIWGLMAAYEKHVEERETVTTRADAGHWPLPPGFDPTKRDHVLARMLEAHRASLFPKDQDLCCGAPDAKAVPVIHCTHAGPWTCRGVDRWYCDDCEEAVPAGYVRPGSIKGPAGADWREPLAAPGCPVCRCFPSHDAYCPERDR